MTCSKEDLIGLFNTLEKDEEKIDALNELSELSLSIPDNRMLIEKINQEKMEELMAHT